MDIIWTRQALRTLESITDYIAENNPIAAYDVTEAIRQAVEPLANFPEMGRRGRIVGTRKWPVSRLPYLIIYRIRGNAVKQALGKRPGAVLYGLRIGSPAAYRLGGGVMMP